MSDQYQYEVDPRLQSMFDQAVLGLFYPPPNANPNNRPPSSFITTLFASLRLRWSESIPTAGTNGLDLVINPEFFEKLSNEMRVTVLAHEIWHVAFQHTTKMLELKTTQERRYYNMAADHVINLMLQDYGYQFDFGLMDSRFQGMSSDQVYEIILQEQPPIDLPFGDDVEPCPEDQLKEAESAVVRADTVRRMSSDPGNMPGEIVSRIDRLLNPKLAWEQLFRKYFDSNFGSLESSWSNPNRRYVAQGMYMPGYKPSCDDLEAVFIGVDSSGSVDNAQLRVINTELANIKERFSPEKMTLVICDTAVRDVKVFDKDTKFEGLSFPGRGGTDLKPVFDLANKEDKVSLLVMCTDLFCAIPPEPKYPVLWICIDNPLMKVPYGTIIHVDSKREDDEE